MKKTIIATAVVASLGLAACTEEAKAEVSLYGSAEQAISSDNGVMDLASGDNYFGVEVSESFGEGAGGAFAKIEIGVDPEGAMTTRESYVGLDMGNVSVIAGRQKNVEKTMLSGLVDIFEGNSVTTANDSRVNNAVSVASKVGGVTVAAATITDGGAGQEDIDAYELGAKGEIAGVSAVVTYVKDRTTDVDSVSYGASLDVAGATVGATYQPDADTTTVAGSVDMGGNTVKLAQQIVDGGNNTTVAELQHNFSKSTSAYVNWSKVENDDAVSMVGMRVVF